VDVRNPSKPIENSVEEKGPKNAINFWDFNEK
jgi:hypothetical protein